MQNEKPLEEDTIPFFSYVPIDIEKVVTAEKGVTLRDSIGKVLSQGKDIDINEVQLSNGDNKKQMTLNMYKTFTAGNDRLARM